MGISVGTGSTISLTPGLLMVTKSVMQSLKSLLPVPTPGVTVHWVSMLVVQSWKISTSLRVTFLSISTSPIVSGVGVVMEEGVVASVEGVAQCWRLSNSISVRLNHVVSLITNYSYSPPLVVPAAEFSRLRSIEWLGKGSSLLKTTGLTIICVSLSPVDIMYKH